MLAGAGRGAGPRAGLRLPPGPGPAGHVYGVDSPQWRGAAADVDRLLRPAGRRAARRTPRCWSPPTTASSTCRPSTGSTSTPTRGCGPACAVVAGEPRVRYLHTAAGRGRRTCWPPGAAVLGDAAWVRHPRARRSPPAGSARCRERTPAAASATWWRSATTTTRSLATGLGARRSVAQLVAFHGSVTAAEMAIPLLVARGAGICRWVRSSLRAWVAASIGAARR